ncbi:MAG: tetratricopeptide repeat protein [Lachnospiraceae bacterium]|nr:tetratricopeptide repeat protein [Lachnospiraceae bacterium]
MKKKIIIVAFTLVGLILSKFAFTFVYNEWVISKYEEKDYSENFSLLEMLNITEPYIVFYNNGNVQYQLKNYEEAIRYYEEALKKDPPEGKECPVRINLALAKLGLLGNDCFSRENIDDTIELLKSVWRSFPRKSVQQMTVMVMITVRRDSMMRSKNSWSRHSRKSRSRRNLLNLLILLNHLNHLNLRAMVMERPRRKQVLVMAAVKVYWKASFKARWRVLQEFVRRKDARMSRMNGTGIMMKNLFGNFVLRFN